ncbi:OmpA family protein [Putridiphycobacter roseus]|nr:OmpA family protein [Putridiphycobacter roseus]
MMKRITLIILLFFSYVGFSQVVDEPFDKLVLGDKPGFNAAVKQIKLGDIDYERGSEDDMANALEHYVKADEFHSKSAYLNYRMGVCYLYSKQKFKAKKHLEFVKASGGTVEDYPDLDFYLARSKHLDGQFDDAIVLFRSYKETLGDSDEEMKFYINKKIQECKVGKELAAHPVRVWVDNLGPNINGPYSDFGPVISADNRELYFTSRRPEGNIGGEKDETGYHYEDIYTATRSFGEDWGAAKNIGKDVNTKSHDATVGISPDGKSLITYHGISRKDGNLLMTKRDDAGNWEKLVDMGDAINSNYHEEAATLSFDEKKLFFVSDKPGGTGGHDIYLSLWDEGKSTWGEAKNLGTVVNTEFDEKGVFFHPDNKTLYFSSAGHKTMGGLDIFKTEYNSETDEWSEPVNIGYPINTPDDDVYFVLSGNERYAYYSSFREGGYGEKDIYMITFLGEVKNPIFASSGLVNGELDSLRDISIAESMYMSRDMVIVRGTVTDANTEAPIMSTVTFTDVATNKVMYELTPEEDGSFMLAVKSGYNYAITSTKPDYTIASDNLVVRQEDEGKEFNYDFLMERLTPGVEFTLRNIYFDYDKSTLRHASVDELNKLLKIMEDNATLRVELSGHTDSRGTAIYNLALSKRRARVAKDYLVSKGIASNRIETKGYGAKQLVVSDSQLENMSSVREKEEAHQKNRRTVVTIIEK